MKKTLKKYETMNKVWLIRWSSFPLVVVHKQLLIKNTNIGFLSWPRKWCHQKNCLVDLKLTAAEKEVEGISIFRHFLSVREINVNL